MSDRQPKLHELLLEQLAELNLTQIAADYRETLDEGAEKQLHAGSAVDTDFQRNHSTPATSSAAEFSSQNCRR